MAKDSLTAKPRTLSNQPTKGQTDTYLIDVKEAQEHLSALGIGQQDPVIICCFSQKNGNVFSPRRYGKKYDWDLVGQIAKSTGREWGTIRWYLKVDTTRSLGFISSPGGTRCSGMDAEIFAVTSLVYEIDNLTLEEQWGLWEQAGLPEPTCVLNTGNKSLHVWYRLADPVSVDIGRRARARLSAAIEAVRPGVSTDHALHSPHQPTRLAGGIHPKTGRRSRLVLNSGKKYVLDELLEVCPQLSEDSKGRQKPTNEPQTLGTFAGLSARGDLATARQILREVLQPADRFSQYEIWRNVGMVCNHSSLMTGDEDALLPDWIKWSEKMHNFDHEVCLEEWIRWSSKGLSEKHLKLGWLIKFVKENINPEWKKLSPTQQLWSVIND